MSTISRERQKLKRGSARTMLAMRLTAPERFEPVEAPRPRAAPRHAVVRIEGCGVCGSNLDPWLGQPWHEYPFDAGTPGHEAWGVVEEIGEGYEGPGVGERVATLSGRAFAEFDAVHESQVIGLPRTLDGRDVPAEPLACAMNVIERSRISAGDVVAVVGVGYLGSLLVQLADRAGATVHAFSKRRSSRRTALEIGAKSARDLNDLDASADAIRQEEGRLCDVVIEAAGAQAAIDAATTLTRVRGRLVIAGYHQDGSRTVNMQLWNWRGIDVINAHERDPERYVSGMRRAVEAMSDNRLHPDPLHTHEMPLTELNDAMRLLRDRPEGFVKAIVRPHGVGSP